MAFNKEDNSNINSYVSENGTEKVNSDRFTLLYF